MNGATTDPLVRTTRPPNTAMTTSSGMSQNFLRARMNPIRSLIKDIGTSERLLERIDGGALLVLLDPIAIAPLASAPHRVNPERAHDKTGRDHAEHEYGSEEKRVRDLVKQETEPAPAAIERCEDAWRRHARAHQQGSHGEKEHVETAE